MSLQKKGMIKLYRSYTEEGLSGLFALLCVESGHTLLLILYLTPTLNEVYLTEVEYAANLQQ